MVFHRALNNYFLTLNGAINDTTTTIAVTGVPGELTPILPVYMSIEAEIMEVTAVNVSDLTVVRGVSSTNAANHDNGGILNLYIVADIMNEVIDSLENPNDPVLNGDVSGTAFLDEDDMISDSETKLASQQSIKRYVDDAAGAGLVLGETNTTAYRGDRGTIAFDHSQLVTGNPHAVTQTEVGLGNVDDTSDATKNAATATLTNKTLTTPAINSPTGLVKGDVGLGNVDDTSDATKDAATATLTNKTLTTPAINSPTGLVKGDVGLGNVDDTSDATKDAATATLTNKSLTSPVLTGTISGDAFLDEDNMASDSAVKLASQQSIKKYVDDAAGAGLVLGETSITAYRGDRGKIAFDHSQLVTGNPHAVTKLQVSLGNVDDTSDATKDAATATLTNKTLTTPAINSPTGLVKGDVGLGSVDNTSDATKDAATATLTNKTLTTPAINSPTGLVKGDVGLGNVDNTSDATKDAASVTLTNKSLTSPVLTGTISGDAFLDEDDMNSDSATKLASQQSIKKYVDDSSGGGGGQTLYDAVVDAAGGGDYLLISLATAALGTGASIWVRNGVYVETTILVKENQKIIGESVGGVRINTTGAITFDLSGIQNWDINANTRRDANNTAWEAGGIGLGTLTCTKGSAVMTYAGSDDPVATGAMIIGRADYYGVVSVDTGLNQITVDRTYSGESITGQHAIVSSKLPINELEWTTIKNMVITHTGGGSWRGVYCSNNYGVWVENIECTSDHTGTSNQGLVVLDNKNQKHRWINCKQIGSDTDGNGFMTVDPGCSDITMKDLDCTNAEFSRIAGNANNPIAYVDIHFKNIQGLTAAFFLVFQFIVNSTFEVDYGNNWKGGLMAVPAGTVDAMSGGFFRLGNIRDINGGAINLTCNDTRVDLGRLEGVGIVKVTTQASSTNLNIITGGNIDSGAGLFTVDGNTIIASGVVYPTGSLTGVPAVNDGYAK